MRFHIADLDSAPFSGDWIFVKLAVARKPSKRSSEIIYSFGVGVHREGIFCNKGFPGEPLPFRDNTINFVDASRTGGSEMGFFGKLMTLIRGFFIRAGDDMVSGSPEAIRSTYAAAIADSQKRYKDLETAVALLARERERTEDRLKELDREEQELTRKLEGALASAEAEPNDMSHREAGIRYQTRIQEIDDLQLKLTQDLEAQKNKVEEYKLKLRGFKEEIDRLKREQGEMVAEYVSNQQVIMLEDRLKGLGESVVDQSVVAIREKIAGLKAQAKIASEMNQASSGSMDQKYEQLGAQTQAAQKFDDLLKARQGAKEDVKTKTRDLG